MIPLVHQDVPAQQEVLQALHALPAIKEHLITIIATAAHMQEALIQIIAAAAHAVPAQREVLQMPSALPAIKEHIITIIAIVAHMEPLTPTHHAVLYVAPLTILTPVPVMMFIGIIHAEQKKTKKKNAVTGQGGITYINAMATNHKEGIGQEDALATVATLLQIIGRIGAVPAQAIKFAQAALALQRAHLTILTPVPVMMFIGIIHAEQKKTKKKNAVTGQGGITYINAMATNHKEGIGQEDALATVATLLQIIGRIGAVPAQAIKFAQAVPA